MNYLKKGLAFIVVYVVFVGLTWEPDLRLWAKEVSILFWLFELGILLTIINNLVSNNDTKPTDNQDSQGY